MTIFNRRNAMLGWATWTVSKKYAERKAKSAAAAKRGRSKKALVFGALAAAGAFVLFWRHKGDDELPPPAE